MSNYTKIVDYAAKDLLLTGDPAKAGKGTEIGAEFDAIAAMSATKADLGANTFTGTQTLSGVALNEAATVIVASATSTAIGAAASNNVDISGTTTITGFGTVAEGINRKGRFTGVLTLTHNATSLILPGGANITTAANDRYEARSLGAGNWIVTKYERANGGAIGGIFKVGTETTPAWLSTLRVVDIGARTGLVEHADGAYTTAQNVYFDGTDYRYRVTGTAILDQLEASGRRVYYTAPSGTAGAVATFTERFSISNTGVATVNGNVVRHDGNIFHGRVNSDGTAARLPAGWASSRVGLGDYQVTHTVATANFSVAAATNSFGSMASAALYTTTAFRISTADHAGTAVDVPFNFTLMLD